MWRTALAALALAVGIWFVIDWMFTSDQERVEQKLRHLIERAEQGGEDAVDEILAAFAADYEGEGSFTLERIERELRRHVAPGRVRSIVSGDFKTIWLGGEIHVPILRLTVQTEDAGGTMLLEVRFAEEEDDWRIVRVSRWKTGR